MNRAVPDPADPPPSASGSLPRIGEQVAGCTITGRLGEGAMGAVFRARDAAGREVALKLILDVLSQEAALRLAREGRITASLSHPGIVTVHSAGMDQGRPYLVYELVEGTTLEARFNTLEREPLLEIVLIVARAIGYAHTRGVLHRDLKPENILLDAANTPRVADFGLAQATDQERLTQSGALFGTPVYMAPEQARGTREEFGPHTDVWALGVLLYRVLTGETPFRKTTLVGLLDAITTAKIPPPTSSDPTIPKPLAEVCMKALAKAPKDRFPDGNAFAAALAAALQRDEPERSPFPLKAFLGSALLLGVVGAGVGWAFSDRDPIPAIEMPPVMPTPTSIPPPPAPRPRVAAVQNALRALGGADPAEAIHALRAVAQAGEALSPSEDPELVRRGLERGQALLDTDPGMAVSLMEALARTGLHTGDPIRGSTFMTVVLIKQQSGSVSGEAYWRILLAAAHLDISFIQGYLQPTYRGVHRDARPWSKSPRDPWKRYLHMRRRLARDVARAMTHGPLEDLLLTEKDPPIQLGPRHWADSAALLAWGYRDIKKADALFREAERRDPTNAELHYHWARALGERDQKHEAVEHAERALELLPTRINPRHEYWTYRRLVRGALQAHADLNQRPQARKHWQTLSLVAPNSAADYERSYPWLSEGSE